MVKLQWNNKIKPSGKILHSELAISSEYNDELSNIYFRPVSFRIKNKSNKRITMRNVEASCELKIKRIKHKIEPIENKIAYHKFKDKIIILPLSSHNSINSNKIELVANAGDYKDCAKNIYLSYKTEKGDREAVKLYFAPSWWSQRKLRRSNKWQNDLLSSEASRYW